MANEITGPNINCCRKSPPSTATAVFLMRVARSSPWQRPALLVGMAARRWLHTPPKHGGPRSLCVCVIDVSWTSDINMGRVNLFADMLTIWLKKKYGSCPRALSFFTLSLTHTHRYNTHTHTLSSLSSVIADNSLVVVHRPSAKVCTLPVRNPWRQRVATSSSSVWPNCKWGTNQT